MMLDPASHMHEPRTASNRSANVDKVFLVILGVLGLAAIGYAVWLLSARPPAPIACTTEAKICPDGSAVGRTGPRCEFAPCPPLVEEEVEEDGWSTAADPAGVSFRYPARLATTYIHTVDWPPKAAIQAGVLACTEPRTIDGREFCVTAVIEGAAGSVYTRYAYAFAQGGQVVTLTFTLRAPQCGNYDDAQRVACEQERADFDLDALIGGIAGTLRIDAAGSVTGEGTGLRGTALLGPTCPVQRDPPDPKCADKPYGTSLVLTTADGARVITTFSSDKNGKFKVEAAPGEYAIRSAAAANILPYCASQGTFQVRQGSFTEVVVSCDTGIR